MLVEREPVPLPGERKGVALQNRAMQDHGASIGPQHALPGLQGAYLKLRRRGLEKLQTEYVVVTGSRRDERVARHGVSARKNGNAGPGLVSNPKLFPTPRGNLVAGANQLMARRLGRTLPRGR